MTNDLTAIRAQHPAEVKAAQLLTTGFSDTILSLCDEVERLRAENERLRNFIADFSETKFDRIDCRAPDPQDDLDPLTDYLAIEAWQEDARAALAQKGGEADHE